MPLYGIRTPEAEQLRFVWMSGRMLHSVLVMSAVTVLSVMSIIWIATGQTTIDRLRKRAHNNMTLKCNIPSHRVGIYV